MRILHTADWHLGRTLEGRSRGEEQEAFLDELVALVREEQIDLVLMAGDAYDSVNPPASAEKLFYDGLSRLAEGGKRKVAVIAGNHDNPERLAASWPLAEKQGITLVGLPIPHLQTLTIERTGEQATLLALPYPSESRLSELLADEADEASLRTAYSDRIKNLVAKTCAGFKSDTVNLIMSHLYVLGGAESESERPIQVGGAYTVDTAALCAKAQYVALGHLHRPQTMKAGDLIRYSGSPLAYSFSEAGQAKSVTILEVEPGKPAAMQELPLSCGRPLVHWKAKGGLAEVHRWLEEGRDHRAWIDLELHLGDSLSMEQIQSLRRHHTGIIHIRPVYPEMEAMETIREAQVPMDEMFRRFYARQTGGAQPDTELVQLFMELLHETAELEAAAGKEEGA
ncbi:exonuclease SbcCD subunit D [Paenibacillus aurantius]|uniref:Nuclease SbcCD subunit D n=1 Tax=Paenibacillus aurantius TaxID=2918900 RepID=A0AA96LG69_9BACL|nr:exonuclease SbcCD subunit D [Paenibacillus aurantius]WNQ13449.1 exonuclease SbcCD subunit D [Paenibacillus aurantius]